MTQSAVEPVGELGGVRAIEYAAAILYRCAEGGGQLGVREFARELSAPKSTVHRILGSLEQVGLLAYDERAQSYVVGEGAVRLGARFLQRNDLVSAALPHMTELRDELDETVCLHVRVQDRRITLCQLESTQPLRYAVDLARTYSLLSGSVGYVLLSLLADADVCALAEREALSGSPVDVDELLDQARAVRERGYALTRGTQAPGGVGISAPIQSPGSRDACLSVYAPTQRIPPKSVRTIAPRLIAAATAIANELEDHLSPTPHSTKEKRQP